MKSYVVAEIASNWEGDLVKAKRLIRECKNAGAHAVKFQMWRANDLYSHKHPQWKFIKKSELKRKIKSKLSFPVVIKPFNEGSSVEVYICSEKNLFKNLNKLSPYKEIMIEKYIPGREIQVAIMGKRKLGAIELVPKRKFYDYQAKYDVK